MSHTQLPDLIDIHQLMELTDLGRTAAYAMTRRPDFPEPYCLGPKTFRWDRAEVAVWLTGCRGRARVAAPPRRNARPTRRPSSIVVDGVTFRRNK